MASTSRKVFKPSLDEFERAVEIYARGSLRKPCLESAPNCAELIANRMWETDLVLLTELAFGEEASQERGWREFQRAEDMDDGLVSLEAVNSWIRSKREGTPREEVCQMNQISQFSFSFLWSNPQPCTRTPESSRSSGFCSLVETFLRYDCDANGVICAKDLCFAMARLTGEELSLQDCKRMIQRVDANNDGVVDLSEFVHMMGPSRVCAAAS